MRSALLTLSFVLILAIDGEAFDVRRFVRSLNTNSIEISNPDNQWVPNPHLEIVNVCDPTNSNNSFIYCSGRLLEAVMYHNIYADSKTFVDKPMKFDAKIVYAKFQKEFNSSIPVAEINKTQLKAFIDSNFDVEGKELDSCELSDWKENPELITRIQDKTLRNWALELNKIWKELCRKIIPDVKKHPDRHSLLWVPHEFVVPGGRFREFYYWDAYWIIKGLLVSGMHETSKSMIRNFAYIVDTVGFIPNGGRVYYLQRSQPPFLCGMVYEYYEATHDVEFIKEMLPVLEKEMDFWDRERSLSVTVNGIKHLVYQYRTNSNVPRPESFREDVELTKQLTKEFDKRQIYQDLASAAESGWDFSSRWFNDSINLRTIQTTAIVPVDLNAYMCWNYNLLSHLFSEADEEKRSKEYRQKHLSFRDTFQKVFYVKKQSGWYDYNLKLQRHNFDFYPSIATPLFTRCYHSVNLGQSERIFYKMEEMGVFNFAGGVPTSLNKESGQQWDYPNGWSPLNHMLIDGLRKSENPSMQQKAFWLAEKWVLSNYRVFTSTKNMWEKYNVIGTSPLAGTGGEYQVQNGFGWTNGVVLDLLNSYSDRMHFTDLDKYPDEVALDVIERPQPPPNVKATNLPQNLTEETSQTIALAFQGNFGARLSFSLINVLVGLFWPRVIN